VAWRGSLYSMAPWKRTVGGGVKICFVRVKSFSSGCNNTVPAKHFGGKIKIPVTYLATYFPLPFYPWQTAVNV